MYQAMPVLDAPRARSQRQSCGAEGLFYRTYGLVSDTVFLATTTDQADNFFLLGGACGTAGPGV